MTSVLVRERQREKTHREGEGKIGTDWNNTASSQEGQTMPTELEEAMNRFSPRPFGGNTALLSP